MATFKKYWSLLGKSIYVGERKEKNLKMCAWIDIVIVIISGIMTIINIIHKSGFVTITTAAFFFFGIASFISIKLFKNKLFAVISILILCTFSFTYYAITGVNEGFAILWTLLIPVAYCYFIDVKCGIIMLLYYEILFIVLYYTPIKASLEGLYTETFMNRFPLLYLCGLLINASAMIQYHITTLSQIETEMKLKETVAIAKAADNAKSNFLAQMSHEIRTPINTVLGMNEMILRKTTDTEILNYASDIRNSGNTLLSLINSILDFSKIEEGKMELIPAKYSICDIVDTLLKSVEDRAKAKELIINTEIDPKIPTVLFGDDVKLTQIISNLLTNAIKYTDLGHVDFKIKCNWKNTNSVLLLVSVADTGIGIKEEDLKKLFNSFERLDITHNRNIEGTGLGMSIVTKLLDMMNSRLVVNSEYGRGSVFSFKVYQKIIDATPIGDYRTHIKKNSVTSNNDDHLSAPDARILVVDDNPMNLKVASHLLNLFNINADLAESGIKALLLMEKNSYNIVFMDHMMPQMDGIKTLQVARSKNLLPPETKVIALTANAINGAKDLYLSSGFDDYLSKPINTNELTEKLREYLPKSILAGKDHNKPRQNEVENQLSSAQNTSSVPEKQAESFESAGNNLENSIVFDSQDIAEAIDDDEILEFAPVEEESEADIRETFVFNIPSLKNLGVDTDSALSYCAYDENLYNEILNDFIYESESRKNELNTFCSYNNMHDYKIKIHAMKSLSRTLGFNELSQMALELEHAASDSDVEYVSEHHKDFIREYDKIINSLVNIKT